VSDSKVAIVDVSVARREEPIAKAREAGVGGNVDGSSSRLEWLRWIGLESYEFTSRVEIVESSREMERRLRTLGLPFG